MLAVVPFTLGAVGGAIGAVVRAWHEPGRRRHPIDIHAEPPLASPEFSPQPPGGLMRMRPKATFAASLAVATLVTAVTVAGAASISKSPVRRSSPGAAGQPPTTAAAGAPTIAAAGDIACPGEPCDSNRRTARLIRRLEPTAVLTLGDNQYEDGALDEFLASYDLTWGRFIGRTHPSPVNHEYHTAGADGYFDYFGRRAHRKAGGYYSFDVGDWHILALNSGTGDVSDQQLDWVRSDLASDDHVCELAYWHHPRWSSGKAHGSNATFDPLWGELYDAGVDVVLNGHEHNYERFAPLDRSGEVDRELGIREFVVGTGGMSHYGFGDPITGSKKRIDDRFGVLEMTLRSARYDWRFLATGGDELDSGSKRCHA